MGAHQVRKDQQEHMVLNIQIFNNKRKKKPREIWKSTNCKQKRCVRAVSTAKSTGFFLSSRKDGGEVGKVGARGQSSEEGGKTSRGWVCVVQPLSFSYRTASYLLKKKRQKKYRNKVEMSHSGFKISTSRFCFNWLSKEKEEKKLNKSCFFFVSTKSFSKEVKVGWLGCKNYSQPRHHK